MNIPVPQEDLEFVINLLLNSEIPDDLKKYADEMVNRLWECLAEAMEAPITGT